MELSNENVDDKYESFQLNCKTKIIEIKLQHIPMACESIHIPVLLSAGVNTCVQALGPLDEQSSGNFLKIEECVN